MSYAVVAADPPTTANAVAERSSCDCDGKDFEHHLTSPGVHMFTANWCGHCRRMRDGIKAEVSPSKDDFEIEDVKKPYRYYEHEESVVDWKQVGENYFEVKGFPTIYFVKRKSNGELIKKPYEGTERTKQAIDAAYESFLNEGKKG